MSKPAHVTVRSKETLRYKKPSEEKNEKRRRKLKQIEREKSKQATNYKERKK